MARLPAGPRVPAFGSCFAALRAVAAVMILPVKLRADAILGTTPRQNATTARSTATVTCFGRLAEGALSLTDCI